MNRQEDIEEILLNTCPVCKSSNNLEEVYLSDVKTSYDQIISQDVRISTDWSVNICTKCIVAWAVPTWVAFDENPNQEIYMEDHWNNDWEDEDI